MFDLYSMTLYSWLGACLLLLYNLLEYIIGVIKLLTKGYQFIINYFFAWAIKVNTCIIEKGRTKHHDGVWAKMSYIPQQHMH